MSPASLAISILALVVATSMTSAAAAGSAAEQQAATIGPAAVKNGEVTTKKIRNGAVTTKKLKNRAVGTKKLKNGAVGTKKLKNGAVTNAKIANGTIEISKLSAAALDALQGAQGPKGDKGDTGAEGPKGDQGDPGMSGYQRVSASVGVLPGGASSTFSLECPAGKLAIGGGWNIPPHVNDDGITVSMSQPAQIAGNSGWRIHALSHQASNANVTMYVLCVDDAIAG